MDFVKCLETDIVLNIFNCLVDPADLVIASKVSRDWLDFVISNELCKQLCLRQFPQVANVADVHVTVHVKKKRKFPDESEVERKRNHHRVYGALLHTLQLAKFSRVGDCVKDKVGAYNYPDEGGKYPNEIPEKLIFKLEYDTCLVTEIDISPYRVNFQEKLEEEDYSAKSVRFRMGFRRSATTKKNNTDLDQFIWTYTSPEFPITKACKTLSRGSGQQFELPEPVICTGGFVMVELLGRVQIDRERSNPYYIQIVNVSVLGRNLSSAFKAEVKDSCGKFVLKYDSGRLNRTLDWEPPEKRDGGRSGRTKQTARKSTCACGCTDDIEHE